MSGVEEEGGRGVWGEPSIHNKNFTKLISK